MKCQRCKRDGMLDFARLRRKFSGPQALRLWRAAWRELHDDNWACSDDCAFDLAKNVTPQKGSAHHGQ